MADDLTATTLDTEEGLDDWRYLLMGIDATFRAGSLAEAAAFAGAAVALAAEAGTTVDVDIRAPGVVQLALPAGDLRVPAASVAAAQAISAHATDAGLDREAHRARQTEIAIDALDIAAVKPFWKAALGYDDDGPQAIIDPLRIGPPVWFQQMDAIRPERNHIHIDITVPHDVAERRVADVVAAGGVVLDVHKRSFTVLADPEGNEACICTCLDRE